MSDAAIASLATCGVTIATMLIGFLTMWVRLRYGVEKAEEAAKKAATVEGKIDDNNAMTARIEKQTNGPLQAKLEQMADHAERITVLERDAVAIKAGLESLTASVSSKHHEVRGSLQAITNLLHLIVAANPMLSKLRKETEEDTKEGDNK